MMYESVQAVRSAQYFSSADQVYKAALSYVILTCTPFLVDPIRGEHHDKLQDLNMSMKSMWLAPIGGWGCPKNGIELI